MKHWRSLLNVALGMFLVGGAPAGSATAGTDRPPVVAVAASLRGALEDISAAFEASSGGRVRLSFGSTGSMISQVAAGAPYEIVLAADEASVARLEAEDRLDEAPVVFAEGHLVLAVTKASGLAIDGLADLGAALADGRVTRFAIANPEHAPYGRAAREALESEKLWSLVEPRLALGENVSQAGQFIAAGGAQAGLIARSVALELGAALWTSTIPDEHHRPINHSMGLLKGASPLARRFFAYLQGADARAILMRHGLTAPE